MKKNELSIEDLWEQYGGDEYALLQSRPSLRNLHTFSNQREGVVEWIDFRRGSRVLVLNDQYGAVLGILLRRGISVWLYEEYAPEAEFIQKRYTDFKDLLHIEKEHIEKDIQQFDYIILFGNMKNAGFSISDTENLKLLQRKLCPEGKLILACDNRFGIQVLAGAKEEEESLSRGEIAHLLHESGFAEHHFYYPVYDHRFPFTIYSDRRLPSKGELSGYIPAYNFPEYINTDIATKFAQTAENGEFVWLNNAYIVVTGTREKAIYVKYNRTRREEFRIKTVIEEDEGGIRRVVKGALSEKSIPHIQSLAKKYAQLSAEKNAVHYLEASFSADGENAYFPYVTGQSLTGYLGERIVDGKLPEEEIREYLDRICGICGSANHDAIFDNFMLDTSGDGKKELIGIDYEWVQDQPLEKNYLRFRSLRAFLGNFAHKLGLATEHAYVRIYKKFGITDEEIDRFLEKEKEFQDYVHGESQKVYLDNYIITPRTVAVIEHFKRERDAALEREKGVMNVFHEKESTIKKINEVKRLTDNHVINLESQIAQLNAQNAALHESLHVFQRHEALIYKAKRKFIHMLDMRYPQGSKGRKNIKNVRFALTKPAEFLRLHTTKEGKNQIEGEEKIGEEYKQHGILHFPVEEQPTVSIIIPVYNQIHYTYACLVSILEHTKDVSYEVIIADDVSTDATKELDKFAKNLIIARNETNQGFLRNCNQAAKRARGQYLMFLNNDTRVTQGWLSSLVELIERDKSIGMVGSKLVYPDGRLQEAGGILWSDGSGWNYGRLDDPNKCEYNYVKEVDYISGAAILLSNSLWKELGGFDERFAPAYCEDSDLAFSVRAAGYKVMLQPKSVVIHYEGISNGTDVHGSGLKKYQIENSIKLREKWAKEFALQFENNGDPDPFRARERSRGKKIILFVDHYVPTYDKDAGSKTTFQYLKMLLKQGYVVKFLGDNFAKEEPYATTLEQMGIEILYGPQKQGEIWSWIEKHAEDIHLVYLNRPHIATKYIDFIRDYTKIKIIYYGHDLHFLRLQREYELTGDETKLEESYFWKTTEFLLMHKADMSYYPSQVEVDCIHEIDPDIRVKAITAYVYDEFKDISQRNYEKNEGLLFVGGFSHPPNKDAVLWFLREIFPKIREKIRMDFYIVGSNADDEVKALHNPKEGIIFKGFVSDAELEDLYAKAKIAVVPLRYGAGIKGKVIEAMYNGIPVVTTSVGAEGIDGAENVMYIADKAEAFAQEVLRLYEDSTALKRMSEEAIAYIQDMHSYAGAWRVISEEFR